MRKIYVAGKLNDSAVGYIKNVSLMIKTAIEVQRLGFSVFVPCLDLLNGIVAGDYEYTDYADNNMEWLKVSDAILVLPNWKTSKGTLAEIKEAELLGIPIFYSIQELVDYEKPMSEGK